MSSKFGLLIANIVMIGLIFWVAYGKGNKSTSEPTPPPQQSEPAPYVEPEPEPEPEPEKPIEVPEPTKYEEALKASEITGKKIVLYFHAPAWCPPCQKMERETLSNDKVKKALKLYVFYVIDIDKNERSVATHWKVRGVPTYLITDSKEKLYKSDSGFRSPEAFVRWLSTTQKEENHGSN